MAQVAHNLAGSGTRQPRAHMRPRPVSPVQRRRVVPGRAGLILLAWIGVFAGPLALGSLIALPVAIFATGMALHDPVVQGVGGMILIVHAMAVFALVRAERTGAPTRRLVAVRKDDAPALHAFIEQLASSMNARPVQRVLVSTEPNASLAQRQVLFGLGGTRTELTIGLPLLQSLTHEEMTAVLLHELAHSRRSDGRLHALVFRARQQWLRLEEATTESQFVGRGVLRWIAKVYLRALMRRSRVVLRDGEFMADALAADVVGPQILAQAIVRVTQTHDGLNRLWDAFWLGNVKSAAPHTGPWTSFSRTLPLQSLPRRPEAYEFSKGYHPSMAQRLARLGTTYQSVELRYPVATPAVSLLGDAASKVSRHFDEHWWLENKARWTRFYRGVPQQKARLALLDRAAVIDDLSEATAIERAMRAEYLLGTEASIERYRWCLHRFPNSAVARYNLDELLQHAAR